MASLFGKPTKAVAEQAMHRVGSRLFDKAVGLGKQHKIDGKTLTEVVRKGKAVGYVMIENNKVEYEVAMKAGKIISTLPVNGPKMIVKGTNIVGREVVIAGEVIGTETVKAGKIVGHSVVAGGQYVVNKAGDIVMKFLSQASCETLVGIVTGASAASSALGKVQKVADKAKDKLGYFGFLFPGMAAVMLQDMATEQATALTKQNSQLGKAMKLKSLDTFIDKNMALVMEIQNAEKILKKKSKKVAKLFTPKNFCSRSPEQLDKKLMALKLFPDMNAMPNLKLKKSGLFDGGVFIKEAAAANDKTFWWGTSMSLAAAKGLGATVTLSIFKESRGASHAFISVGPYVVSNIEGEVSTSISFFPAVDKESFEGWGSSWNASADLGGKEVDATFDVEVSGLDMEAFFKHQYKNMFEDVRFEGVSFGLAKGFDRVKGDIGLTHDYTFKVGR